MIRITAVLITLNEGRNLANALASLKPVADEIIVVDSYSTDNTIEIAKSFGARVYTHTFEGFIKQKKIATDYAGNNWILSIDADEVLTPELQQSILNAKENPRYDAYRISRITNFCGKWIKHCGWYPDRIVRLFDKTKGDWQGGTVHEHWEPTTPSTIGLLNGLMQHYSFSTIADYTRKIEKYSELGARDAVARGKDRSLLHIWLVPKWNFFTSYILRLGILDGYYGYLICKLSAYESFLKYTKIRQYARMKRQGKPY
jgi:glycosyltransferase involved in cell wall biosynthesis